MVPECFYMFPNRCLQPLTIYFLQHCQNGVKHLRVHAVNFLLLVHIWKWPILSHTFNIFPYLFFIFLLLGILYEIIYQYIKLCNMKLVVFGRRRHKFDNNLCLIAFVELWTNRIAINFWIVFIYCWISTRPEYVWNIYHRKLSNNQSINQSINQLHLKKKSVKLLWSKI